MVTGSVILAAAIYSAHNNFRTARYFIIAFAALVAGSIAHPLSALGVMPYLNGIAYNHSGLIASLAEVIILSFALADRFYLMQEKVKHKAIEAKKELQLTNLELKDTLAQLEKSNQSR